MIQKLAKSLAILILTIVNTIMGGWILACMWKWFVASQFGLPSITIYQAIGIDFIFAYILCGIYLRIIDEDTNTIKIITMSLATTVNSLILFVFAYGLHCLM
jgi:hypothetical protein